MEVIVEPGDELAALMGDDQESRFYSCQVCGDNWLTIKRAELDGQCEITFIHQMGVKPQLKRVAQMQTPVVLQEATVDGWGYFMDDVRITEKDWLDKLNSRRRVMRSICSN